MIVEAVSSKNIALAAMLNASISNIENGSFEAWLLKIFSKRSLLDKNYLSSPKTVILYK